MDFSASSIWIKVLLKGMAVTQTCEDVQLPYCSQLYLLDNVLVEGISPYSLAIDTPCAAASEFPGIVFHTASGQMLAWQSLSASMST